MGFSKTDKDKVVWKLERYFYLVESYYEINGDKSCLKRSEKVSHKYLFKKYSYTR